MPPQIAHTLLLRAHSPGTTERINTEKIVQRPLHLKPTSSTPTTAQTARREARLLKRKKPRKSAPLSSCQKRSLQLYDIPRSAQKYEIYEPLHKMWIGYMQEILFDGRPIEMTVTAESVGSKICSADFHGAEVEVVRSRCPSRVGVKGIVVKDSRHILEIVTKKDEVKVLPKEGTIFKVVVPLVIGEEADAIMNEAGKEKTTDERQEMILEIHGDQFMYRAADRANRKFKSHYLKNL